jgi:uncharacterized protein YndB with AHSA1/START domain
MEQQSVVHSTFVIERSYNAKPERVFAAFADPAQKRRWFIESEHQEVEHYEMDFRVGGLELARFTFEEGTPVDGIPFTTESRFQDIVPNRRLVFAATMTLGEKRISAALVTVEFLPAPKGTDLICTHQGAFFEGADGPAMREEGWRVLLGRLAEEFSR